MTKFIDGVINLVVWGTRWLHQLPTPQQQEAAGESARSHGSWCGSRTWRI